MRTEIAVFSDGLGGNSRKLIFVISLVEMNELDAVLDKVFGHTVELGFVLDCQNDKKWMIWQGAEIKLFGSADGGVRALYRLLRGREVFPHENVDVILLVVVVSLRFWSHRSLLAKVAGIVTAGSIVATCVPKVKLFFGLILTSPQIAGQWTGT